MKKVAVIGGGPAGMTAAIAAAREGHAVTLYDQNEKLGKKLYITGKGRCNLTNNCDLEDFFENVMSNRRFLYSALYTFTNTQLMALIEEGGCPLKIERGDRVFPVSDKSSDVLKAFNTLLRKSGVQVCLNAKITGLKLSEGTEEKKRISGIVLKDNGIVPYDKVILATGGKSYVSTGSDGSGYGLAESVGHHIVPIAPSLVAVNTLEKWPLELQGLSLRNVALTLKKGQKKLKSMQGEMLFTHFGISGPLVLTMSAFLKAPYAPYSLVLDLKPALSPAKLEARLLRDFDQYSNKNFNNSLVDLLPSKMIPVMVKLSGIDPDKKVNQISKEERRKLAECFKNLEMKIDTLQPLNTAIVTAGGVDVKEIDPGSMASKKVAGLSFAGEMVDVDALTGGFNIQIAASTGWLAGISE